VFVTNSVQEIVAVNQLFLPDGQSRSWETGPITTALAQYYERLRQEMLNET
jgi:branched-subunit amino acid aminotransferase/4-amino-4-deoxychorismate lyase